MWHTSQPLQFAHELACKAAQDVGKNIDTCLTSIWGYELTSPLSIENQLTNATTVKAYRLPHLAEASVYMHSQQ